MKLSKSIICLLVFLGISQASHAGIWLEPYLGYHSGTNKQTTSVDFTGMTYGARVGYSFLGFAVGAEYSAASYTDDDTPKNTITNGDMGVFVSYKFPVLFRVYATYIPSSEADVKPSGSSSIKLKDGSGYKIGVGYTGLPFVNINLEMVSAEYGKMDTFDLSPKSKTSGYGLVLSMPFDLL